MTLVISAEAGKVVGRVSLAGGTLTASNAGTRRLAGHALRKAGGDAALAYRALSTFSNGYLDVSEEPGSAAGTAAGQAVTLAAGAAVALEAMQPPGLPVPGDPAAVAIFTAHRTDDALHQLSHAAERMRAARAASGDLRAYHCVHVAGHLQAALDSAHDLTANLREHYPAEAAELEQVKEAVGLAKAVSDDAKAATTAHLLETTLHELTHASRHAQAMLAGTPGAEWEFDASHCEHHLGGAAEHAGKLRRHLADNYPAEGRWLDGLGEAAAGAGEGRTAVTEQAGDAGTICGQLDLAAIRGKHIPGTAYTYRHGWIPLIGGQLNDVHPQWLAEKARAARADGEAHARRAAEVPRAQARILTPKQKAMASYARSHLGQLPGHAAPPEPAAATPAAAAPKTTGDVTGHQDPALAALAGPGMSEQALRAYVDARVATEVAARVSQITAAQAASTRDALAKMHEQQQKLIALTRKMNAAGGDKDDADLQKHTVMNTLFSIAGVGIAIGGIASGLSPVIGALITGIVPLVTTIHDYARNLG